jgi:Carboxypeptidase regulatory-like domain
VSLDSEFPAFVETLNSLSTTSGSRVDASKCVKGGTEVAHHSGTDVPVVLARFGQSSDCGSSLSAAHARETPFAAPGTIVMSIQCPVCLRRGFFQKALCTTLAGLMTIGTPAVAEEPLVPEPRDVVVSDDGLLSGTVMDSAALPVSGVQVAVLHGEDVIATTTSDEEGRFAVDGLRSGSHIVQVAGTFTPVRLWRPRMAPPAAIQRLAVVVRQPVVLGQQNSGFPGMNLITGNPVPFLLIAGALGVVLGTTLDEDEQAVVPASP